MHALRSFCDNATMKSGIDRRTFLIGVTAATTWQRSLVTAHAQAGDKASFMKAAIANISDFNKQLKQLPPRKGWVGRLPIIKPFGDWDYYYLADELKWQREKALPLRDAKVSEEIVTVPKGFVTDLASVPRILWSVLPKTGRYAYAAIVHDYLYWVQPTGVVRRDADEILETAMKRSGVSGEKVWAIEKAVRTLGESAWKKNKSLKRSGEKRFLKVFPDNPLISWSEWKKDPAHFADGPS